MNNETFDNVCTLRLNRCLQLLDVKGGEYSTETDKLHNFKRAAAILGCTPERALLGMQVKHTVSIMDMLDDLEKNGTIPKENVWNEKIGDHLCYDILLDALIKERIAGA